MSNRRNFVLNFVYETLLNGSKLIKFFQNLSGLTVTHQIITVWQWIYSLSLDTWNTQLLDFFVFFVDTTLGLPFCRASCVNLKNLTTSGSDLFMGLVWGFACRGTREGSRWKYGNKRYFTYKIKCNLETICQYTCLLRRLWRKSHFTKPITSRFMSNLQKYLTCNGGH